MLAMRLLSGTCLALLVLSSTGASGQNYPTRPIRIFTTPAGGGADLAARLFAQGISDPLGQPVIIENRPGSIVTESVARAAPDGYTLLYSGTVLWITPLLQKTSYDPVKDFSPIVATTAKPLVLAVNPSLPVNSVKELIALAKARPGQLNYASGQTGGAAHLSGVLFAQLAGINIVRVPYNGAGNGLNAVIAGDTQLMITDGVMPYVKSGKLKALAVSSAHPSVLAPGLPVIAATLPGYESEAAEGVFAPAGTPEPIINRLNQEFVRVIDRADVKEKFLNIGYEVRGGSPEQFAAAIKADTALWGKVIATAKIKVE